MSCKSNKNKCSYCSCVLQLKVLQYIQTYVPSVFRMGCNMRISESLTIEQKLGILADAAKYDVACTSSGVNREGKSGSIGSSVAGGICHSFSADGRCISLLKVLYTNECIYDCKYCINRSSNDIVRTSFTPEELCELTIGFYRRNYIEGLFLSSGILHTPNDTMEQICKALQMLRLQYHFNGYIHCKAIPGADPSLIEMCGWYADRMSVNLELPTAEGLRQLAPHKSRANILQPLRQIQDQIAQSHALLGMTGGNKGAYWYTTQRKKGNYKEFSGGIEAVEQDRKERLGTGNDWLEKDPLFSVNKQGQSTISAGIQVNSKRKLYRSDTAEDSQWEDADLLSSSYKNSQAKNSQAKNSQQFNRTREIYKEYEFPQYNQADGISFENKPIIHQPASLLLRPKDAEKRGFVPAGQSTQMIVGATAENDYQIISVAEALYQKFDLKRVFYSAFVRVNDDSNLPIIPGGPPLLREHRLYQADFLLRFYGFAANELLSEKRPDFNVLIDPKCNWALGHLESFPVEVTEADYFTLLRVPGIGPKSAQRIVRSRKTAKLDYKDLKKMGVVLKRAMYFITCYGKMMYQIRMEESFITSQLIGVEESIAKQVASSGMKYQQLSLF